MTGEGGLVEVQATAERTPLSRAHLDELLALAGAGIERLRVGAGAGARLIVELHIRALALVLGPHRGTTGANRALLETYHA